MATTDTDYYTDIPIGTIDEHTAPERVMPPKLLVANNVEYRTPGEARRRPGTFQFSTEIESVPSSITSSAEGLVYTTRSGGTVQETTNGTLGDVDPNHGTLVNYSRRRAFGTTRGTAHWQSAAVGTTTSHVWYVADSNAYNTNASLNGDDGLYYSVTKASDRIPAVMAKPLPNVAAGVERAWLRACNGYFVVCYYEGAYPVGSSKYVVYDTDGVQTDSGALTNTVFDAHIHPDGDFIAVAGETHCGRLDVDGSGVLTQTWQIFLLAQIPNGTGSMQPMVVVYHNEPAGVILVAVEDSTSTTASDIYSFYIPEACTTNPAGTGTLAWTASSASFTNVGAFDSPLGHEFRMSGSFIQKDAAGDDVAFFYQGYTTTSGGLTNNPTGFGSDHMGYRGVKTWWVDGSTGIISKSILTQLNSFTDANILMVSKPFFDGIDAFIYTCASPCTDVTTVWNGGHPTTAPKGRNYQTAGYLCKVPRDMAIVRDTANERFDTVEPVCSALVDEQCDISYIDIGHVPHQPYQDSNGMWVVSCSVDADLASSPVTPLASVYGMAGVDGADLLFDTDHRGAGAILTGDLVARTQGMFATFDGEEFRPNLNIPGEPLFIELAGDSTDFYQLPRVGYYLEFTDAKNNVHRGAYIEATGLYLPDDTWATESYDAEDVRVPYPPFAARGIITEDYDIRVYANVYSNFGGFGGDPTTGVTEGRMARRNKVPMVPTASDHFAAHVQPFAANNDDETTPYPLTGELQSEYPSGAAHAIYRRGRVFYIDASDRFVVRYSKLIGPVTNIEYNQNLYVQVPEDDGGAVALSHLDDKIIVFSEDSTFYFAGDGPNNLGRGSFTNPRRIASGHGCVNKDSVISTKEGVFFQSRRGLMLLTRQLDTVFIGEGIASSLSASTTIVGAVNDTAVGEIRFMYNDSSDGTIGAFVFNVDAGGWTIWTDMIPDNTSNDELIDTTMHDGRQFMLVKDNDTDEYRTSYLYTPELYAPGFWYYGDYEIRTPWIRPGEAGQTQDYFRAYRLYMLGRWTNPDETPSPNQANIQITAEYNYGLADAPLPVTYTVDATSTQQSPSNSMFEVRLPLDNQKASSVRFTITMDPADLPNTQFSIINLGVELGPKEGGNKVPNTAATRS